MLLNKTTFIYNIFNSASNQTDPFVDESRIDRGNSPIFNAAGHPFIEQSPDYAKQRGTKKNLSNLYTI